jgi:hypothetical protein
MERRAGSGYFLMLLRNLAGAGGFEPPNGGIKIRCLATWLRPTGIGGGTLAIKRRPGNHAAAGGERVRHRSPRRGFGSPEMSG